MKIAGRILLALGLVVALAGCGLSAWGWLENKVSSNASANPVAVDLAKLEAGQKPEDNNLQIGPHYALYFASLHYVKTKKQGRKRVDTEKVDYLFYPIVSTANPDMKELEKLKEKYGDVDNVPEEIDLPVPKNFAVLVKTRRFKKVDDIPLDFCRKEESIRGLVINDITLLTREEKTMIKDEFPDINFKKVLILEDGRSPVSSGISTGAMVGGGCCCFAGFVAAASGFVMLLVGFMKPAK